MKFLLCLSAFLLSTSVTWSYKILVVYPFPAKSHNSLGNGIVRHLLRAGHEVTYITPYPSEGSSDPNLRQIDVSSIINAFPVGTVNIQALMNKDVHLNDDNSLFFSIFGVAEAAVKNENVQKLLNNANEQFDVVIAEWMFNELYSGFAAVFRCPYMWTYPYEPYVNLLTLIDEAPNPAYVPNLVSDNVPPFNFYQRVQELWKFLQSVVIKTWYHLPLEKSVYENVFGPILARRGRPLPPYEELRLNASLILGSSHVSTGLPSSLPQSFKSIAGYYIEEDVKPLPENLQKLMDNSKEGVVYFSLGSNLKSKELPEAIKNDLIKMFGELKQDIIWKFEEELPGLPKNVHILKWAPQHSILAHPNCKVFITHGGLLSTTEAVYFGVPLIGIPVFVDQFNNVNRAVHKGSARRVDISYSLAADLKDAIEDIIGHSRYLERAKELSLIFHDRPVSPGAELVHWVEHVVRTRGALHLRSPALHLPFYQKLYLDLAAVILIALLLITLLIKRLLQMFCLEKKELRLTKKKRN